MFATFITREIYKQVIQKNFLYENFFYSYRAQVFIKPKPKTMLFEKIVFKNLANVYNYIFLTQFKSIESILMVIYSRRN